MIIYGAGMAGLMAANVMRRHDPVVHEAQKELPNNHGALLRFRSDACSKATNIPFKKVKVQKLIFFDNEFHVTPNLHMSNLYSQKVTGEVLGRSINNLEPVERYIAPSDFIGQMANSATIEYDSKLTKDFLKEQRKGKNATIISTIPMPMLMKMIDWPDMPEFKWKPITSVWGKINKPKCDVYQTIYYPDPELGFYRISITGDVYIAEYNETVSPEDAKKHALEALAYQFGIIGEVEELTIKHQEYGKLLPIDEAARKEFILYMTDEYRLYSLGRFATWRQILLDDLVGDLELIGKLIDNRDNYKRKLMIHK